MTQAAAIDVLRELYRIQGFVSIANEEKLRIGHELTILSDHDGISFQCRVRVVAKSNRHEFDKQDDLMSLLYEVPPAPSTALYGPHFYRVMEVK